MRLHTASLQDLNIAKPTKVTKLLFKKALTVGLIQCTSIVHGMKMDQTAFVMHVLVSPPVCEYTSASKGSACTFFLLSALENRWQHKDYSHQP